VLTDPDSRRLLAEASSAVMAEQHYQALKALRGLLPREERLLAAGPGMSFQPVIAVDRLCRLGLPEAHAGRSNRPISLPLPTMKRDADLFRRKIGTVDHGRRSGLRPPPCCKVALGAYGLDGDIDNKAFIRKVLSDGTLKDPIWPTGWRTSLLHDGRRPSASIFGTPRPSCPISPTRHSPVRQRQFEAAVGEQNNSYRLAMNAEREIATWRANHQRRRQVVHRAGQSPAAPGVPDRPRVALQFRVDGPGSAAGRAEGAGEVDLRVRGSASSPIRTSCTQLVRTYLTRSEIANRSPPPPAGPRWRCRCCRARLLALQAGL
jgi:hypothetical protein